MTAFDFLGSERMRDIDASYFAAAMGSIDRDEYVQRRSHALWCLRAQFRIGVFYGVIFTSWVSAAVLVLHALSKS